MKRKHWSWLPILLIPVAIMALSSCASEEGPRPNIVIIIMDTARQDHLSCYGYSRETTPTLDTLVRESTLYRTAYSVSSWTSPAHASLFTGLYPAAHGCTQENWTMAEDLVTLAEVLGPVGYQTVGITENPTISGAAGFGQGFDSYHECWRPREYGEENPAFVHFENTVANLDRSAPFFVFVNFIEPHAPYNSSREFMDTWVNDPRAGPVDSAARDFYLGRVTWSEGELDHMRALYDAEILYTDHQIGRMIDLLQGEGLWDDTIFIVTSDHGENIGDHEHVDHYFNIYESTVKIPLIIHYPPLFPPGAVDSETTQITDLYPTLLNLLKLDAGVAQGMDLLDPEARRNRPVLCEYYWPTQALESFGDDWDDEALNRWKRRLKGVIYRDNKLIWSSDGKHELYDLESDPLEEHNLIASPDAVRDVEALTALLEALIKRYGVEHTGDAVSGGPELDEETLEALRALGYIQ